MSSTIIFGGRRIITITIQSPGRLARVARFSGRASHSVSKRPIWLAEAARPIGAPPPTTQRIAGSWHSALWRDRQEVNVTGSLEHRLTDDAGGTRRGCDCVGRARAAQACRVPADDRA